MSEKQILKKSYFWNMMAGLLNASQSFVFMFILTRVIGVDQAGFFSFAYALANQFLSIGKFGMRNFQVTDMNEKYNFKVYFYSRIITNFFMIIAIIIYCLIKQNDYERSNMLILIFLCIWKVIDSFDDLFQGFYQQMNRLDIGAFWFSVRTGVTVCLCLLIVLLKKELDIALLVAVFFTIIMWIYGLYKSFVPNYYGKIKILKVEKHQIIDLFKDTFPLFVSTFLLFYLDNAAKYAIDTIGNNYLQAIYGFVSMPVLFISLLNFFFLQPVMSRMALYLQCQRFKEFLYVLKQQVIIFTLISLFVVMAGGLFGLPILSIFYDVDLLEYKREFLILLVSGSFSFLASGLLNSILIMMRKIKTIIIIHTLLFLVAVYYPRLLVEKYGLLGASISQLGIMILMTLGFGGIVVFELKKYTVNRSKVDEI